MLDLVVRRGQAVGRLASLLMVAALAAGCSGGTSSEPGGLGVGSPDADTPDAVAPDIALADAADPGDGGADAALPYDGGPDTSVDAGPPAVVSESFTVRGTVEQIYVWKAEAEAVIEVVSPAGEVVASEPADALGSRVFRDLVPGAGYVVRLAADPSDRTEGVTVLPVEGSTPSEAFYASQVLQPGYGYITMRDGTQLSVFVSLPGPVDGGPYPTVVNYSGYSPSQPGDSMGPEVTPLCGDLPVLCNAPHHPSGLLAGLGGYASVGVNMRGTGCSGGAYDYFEPLQLLDGYDAIEIIARQPWVLHHKVGMAGLSYPGITQLFVARTRPPSLAAIAPMAVIADSASSTLAPGGLSNKGFALSWIENVLNRALPYGHKWIQDLVDAGDTLCADNQLLHGQMVDVVQKALDNPYYTDAVAKPVDPSSFVQEITVPVFLTGQWQDEQTGPHFAALLDQFTGTDVARFTVTNGVHPDGYSPQTLMEWKTFLDLYVARRVPEMSDQVRALVPIFYAQSLGAALELAPNRFEGYTDYEAARADYEAEPPLRVIFESGADPDVAPGAPKGTHERHFDAWPIPSTVARRWYLQPDGSLGDAPPAADGGQSGFHPDPAAGVRTTLKSGDVSALQPKWDYRPLAEGKALAFVTAPLTEDMVMIGHGSVDLWLRSTAADADLEVAITEVRPDGMESLVQNGWLRASHRALREDATELRPVKTHKEEDAKPLPAGEWSSVRVEIMPFAHIFRAGSRIRLSIDTPGDSMASWHFILLDLDETETHTVAHHAAFPSSVALPWIPGLEVPTALPPCTSLRGQPCRTYVPVANTPEP